MIGYILRAYKNEHGLTVRQLAGLLEEHYSTISLWMNGKREPNMQHIRKIRQITEVPYEQLLGDSLAPVPFKPRPTEVFSPGWPAFTSAPISSPTGRRAAVSTCPAVKDGGVRRLILATWPASGR